MSNILYFATGSNGELELSDGEQLIGHIDQIGLEFTILPTAGSHLEDMEKRSYPSKQEAMGAIEIHTGKSFHPLPHELTVDFR